MDELSRPRTAAWMRVNTSEIDDQALERIKKLENDISQLQLQLTQKDSMLQRFEQWQIGDKYLAQDDTTNEVIEEHKFKQNLAHEKENKEMADAAYETIKTMQVMLDQKNEQLKKKEDHIANLRDHMRQQAELDANQINKLREQISITGSSTLNKMHEIVSKNQGDGNVDQGRAQASASVRVVDRKTRDHLQAQLDDKDHLIK